MAWVAVDKDGSEYVYQDKPIRKNEFFDRQEYESELVLLPKGSIKKLIGRKLIWKDEPVELEEAAE